MMLGTVFHVAALGYYVWLLHFVMALQPAGRGDPTVLQQYLDFRPKYLSLWGLASQVAVMALSVAVDAARLLHLPPDSVLRRARGLRDLVFVGVAAPLALTGSAMYAGLCLVDRGLVMPASLEAALPWWLNHAMHSVPSTQVALQLLAEKFTAPRVGSGIKLALAVCTAYSAVMFHEYLSTGRWLYPVLVVLGWPGRLALSAVTAAFLMGQVPLLVAAIRMRWGYAAESIKVKRT